MDDETTAEHVTAHAQAAQQAITDLTHATQGSPEVTAADIASTLGHLADLVAALPQVCNQLSTILDTAQADQLLTMDTMTDVSDPQVAVDVAKHHLDTAREHAVELYKDLDGAHQSTAHLIDGRPARLPRATGLPDSRSPEVRSPPNCRKPH